MNAYEISEMNNAELASFYLEVCETPAVYGAEALAVLRKEVATEIIHREMDDSALFWDRLYA